MSPHNPDILENIRMLLTDVDGVLTDGRLHYGPDGKENKVFHVYDGAAIAYWHRAGLLSGFVSGRACTPVEHRARDLKIHEVHLGHLDKLPVVEDIARRHNLSLAQIAYIGDDLLDLPVLRAVGFGASVANARPEVRADVSYVTETPGGGGALREVVELILKAKGLWDQVVATDGRA